MRFIVGFVMERGIIQERRTINKNYYCWLSFPSEILLLKLDEIPATDISFLVVSVSDVKCDIVTSRLSPPSRSCFITKLCLIFFINEN
jgi:hypothetical protein